MDASNITDIAKVTDPQMGRLGTLASDMQKTYADATAVSYRHCSPPIKN
jgi:hypothetical protein